MKSYFSLKWSTYAKFFFCLFCLLDSLLFSVSETGLQLKKAFKQLCAEPKLTPEEKTFFLAKKAAELDCPFERIPTHDSTVFQYFYEGDWKLLDTWHNTCYLQLDNHSLASFEEIADDPFLVLRTKMGGPSANFSLSDSWNNLAHFKIIEHHDWPSMPEGWENVNLTLDNGVEEGLNTSPVEVLGFDKFFTLSTNRCEAIWWQITSDKNFDFLIPNLNQIQISNESIELDPLCQTFLNPEQEYFIRIKGLQNGMWSNWTNPFKFHVTKPLQVKDVEFSKKDKECYELSWQAEEDSSTHYWIFGSNALDFVPPIYASAEQNIDYALFISQENHIQIDPQYAFYRVIAERDGIYAVPSEIIRIYDEHLRHPRTLLQIDKHSGIADRKILAAHGETDHSRPKNPKPAHISDHVWQAVFPYLLPENHPLKGPLDRIFSKSRALSNVRSLKQAGFYWTKKGSYSAIYPTRHKKIKGYFIKIMTDEQENEDWKNWISRIYGAQATQKAIDELGYQSLLKVPKKYIYVLPHYPSPTSSCKKRKNFILLSEDMGIVERGKNKKMFRKKITKAHLNAIYNVVTKVGLKDSLYYNNIPWAKDGRLAFVDTEHHHAWPVLYNRFFKLLSPEMLSHWKALIQHKGPNF
ncbi:hypothetical protein [Parachlamydia sp. AcF125]|uniref:hypothetical protein n=1 Tax=Parachlamydia sp. AcF125 TaxID=2795736 RepID=UPI001BC962DA|nr:hypothetical protein [Parachlamydia sp. AcF125]MBS4168478.1 hypothetical protein [Parachlamydia sp. AcF125]